MSTARTWQPFPKRNAPGCAAPTLPMSRKVPPPSFNPSSTIMEQVIEVTRIHKLMPPEQARQRAVELFRALSLPDPEGIGARYPHQVSGGQLQRLAAAMALIGDPEADDLRRADDGTRRDDADRRAEGIQVGHAGGRDSGCLRFPRPRGRRPDRRPHRGAEGRRSAGDRHHGRNPFGRPAPLHARTAGRLRTEAAASTCRRGCRAETAAAYRQCDSRLRPGAG